MILAIDMGNTNIKLGLVDTIENVREERVNTDYDRTSFEYAEHILTLLSLTQVKKESIENAVISSVVPPLTAVLSAAVNKVFGFRPMIITEKTKTKVDFGRNFIGADLRVGAEAAASIYGTPCIIINMGTATTITAVNRDGKFLGGSILPGMKTSLNALSKNTAILPEISIEAPGTVLSLVTEECMRSGIIYGSAAQIDGIVERMEEEIGEKCTVVATGGMAKFCVPFCRHKIVRDDPLLLKGLLLVYEENK